MNDSVTAEQQSMKINMLVRLEGCEERQTIKKRWWKDGGKHTDRQEERNRGTDEERARG